MSKLMHQGVTLECVIGDIAQQPDMDAVVNAANAELRIGGGVAGAIHRAAGPGLEEECRALAPINPGQAVITSAHNLPNRFVIHCLGPVYGSDEPADKLLAACYRNALRVAEEKNIESIAFPAISTGAFGYPIEPATQVAWETILDELKNRSTVRHIRSVLFNEGDQEIHLRILKGLIDK